MQTINAHSKISYSLDPFLELFRALRNDILKQKTRKIITKSAPFSNYFYNLKETKSLSKILNSNCNIKCTEHLPDYVERLIPRSNLDNKDLTPFFSKKLIGKTYRELFYNALKIVQIAKKKQATWVGFHENWVIEFFPALARTFPNAKFIIILRDPRAVIASQCAAQPAYKSTLLSYIRGIRKLMSLAYIYLNNPIFKNRILVIKYEFLIQKPKIAAKTLCKFLGLKFENKMINPKYHFDSDKKSLRNGVSSFEKFATGYKAKRANRWKKVIDKKTLSLTENLLFFDMKRWEYNPISKIQCLKTFLPLIKKDNKKFIKWRTDTNNAKQEINIEILRQDALKAQKNLKKSSIKRFFISEENYKNLKSITSQKWQKQKNQFWIQN